MLNKFFITLYFLATAIFIAVSIADIVNYDIFLIPINEEQAVMTFVPIGLFFGAIAYITSYKKILIKLIPLVVIIIVSWVNAFVSMKNCSDCWNDFVALAITGVTVGCALIFLLVTFIANKIHKRNL